MAPAFDREKILYAVGILLGVAAVAYFGFQLFDQVSPVTTAVVIFAGFVCFLLAGIGLDAETLDLVTYALAAGSYLVFVAYVLSRFDPGDGGTFMLLAGSSALFLGLGYLGQRGRLTLERRRAAVIVLVVLAAAVTLVGVDLVGPQATTSTAFEDSVAVPDRTEQASVGTLTVRNEFVLPRSVDGPTFHACVYGPDFRPARLEFQPPRRSDRLAGGETRSHELRVPGRAFYTANGTLREGFQGVDAVPVETADECPQTEREPSIVIVRSPTPPYR